MRATAGRPRPEQAWQRKGWKSKLEKLQGSSDSPCISEGNFKIIFMTFTEPPWAYSQSRVVVKRTQCIQPKIFSNQFTFFAGTSIGP